MKKNTLLLLSFLAMTFSSINAQEIDQAFFLNDNTTQSRGVLGAWLVDSLTTYNIKVLNVDSIISSKGKYTYTPNGNRKSYTSSNVASTSCLDQNSTYNNKNQEIAQTSLLDDCKGKKSTDYLDSSFYHSTTGLRSMVRRISTTYPAMGNPVATKSIISFFF